LHQEDYEKKRGEKEKGYSIRRKTATRPLNVTKGKGKGKTPIRQEKGRLVSKNWKRFLGTGKDIRTMVIEKEKYDFGSGAKEKKKKRRKESLDKKKGEEIP